MNRDFMKKLHDDVARGLVDRGLLVEAGFHVIEMKLKEQGKNVAERNEAKVMFFSGAHHVFSAIIGILDPGVEPTNADLRRLTQLHTELQAHEATIKQRFGMK